MNKLLPTTLKEAIETVKTGLSIYYAMAGAKDGTSWEENEVLKKAIEIIETRIVKETYNYEWNFIKTKVGYTRYVYYHNRSELE